jgi:hypothetical protein
LQGVRRDAEAEHLLRRSDRDGLPSDVVRVLRAVSGGTASPG